MSAKTEILAAIAAEREQYLAKIEEVLASKPSLPEADKAEILAAIKGIVPDAAPAEDKHNVRLSASTSGDEEMILSLLNNGASLEQATRLDSIFNAVVAAAKGAPEGGPAVPTTFTITDNGATKSESVGTLLQKAYADLALGEAIVATAREQIDALTAAPTE